MGDPQQGQIPDNIFLSIQQLFLKGSIKGDAGTWLIPVSGEEHYTINAASTVDLSPGYAQARVDFDTTDIADDIVAIECLTPPSYVYGIASDTMEPGNRTKFSVAVTTPTIAIGQGFDFADAAALAAGLSVGRYSRKVTESAGNRQCVKGDIIIIKLGVI